MKRLLAVLLLCAGTSFAVEPATVNRSSFVVTAGTYYIPASYLDGIVIGVASAGGTIMLYNSTSTVGQVLISSVSLATVGNYYFNNLAVKGIVYFAATPTNGATILYKK